MFARLGRWCHARRRLVVALWVGALALFIVTRFRENLHAGMDVGRATEVAIDTAGRAVA